MAAVYELRKKQIVALSKQKQDPKRVSTKATHMLDLAMINKVCETICCSQYCIQQFTAEDIGRVWKQMAAMKENEHLNYFITLLQSSQTPDGKYSIKLAGKKMHNIDIFN